MNYINKLSILVVDESDQFFSSVSLPLSQKFHKCSHVKTFEKCEKYLTVKDYDAAFFEVELEGRPTSPLIKSIREKSRTKNFDLPIILVNNNFSNEFIVKMKPRFANLLKKPIAKNQILTKLIQSLPWNRYLLIGFTVKDLNKISKKANKEKALVCSASTLNYAKNFITTDFFHIIIINPKKLSYEKLKDFCHFVRNNQRVVNNEVLISMPTKTNDNSMTSEEKTDLEKMGYISLNNEANELDFVHEAKTLIGNKFNTEFEAFQNNQAPVEEFYKKDQKTINEVSEKVENLDKKILSYQETIKNNNQEIMSEKENLKEEIKMFQKAEEIYQLKKKEHEENILSYEKIKEKLEALQEYEELFIESKDSDEYFSKDLESRKNLIENKLQNLNEMELLKKVKNSQNIEVEISLAKEEIEKKIETLDYSNFKNKEQVENIYNKKEMLKSAIIKKGQQLGCFTEIVIEKKAQEEIQMDYLNCKKKIIEIDDIETAQKSHQKIDDLLKENNIEINQEYLEEELEKHFKENVLSYKKNKQDFIEKVQGNTSLTNEDETKPEKVEVNEKKSETDSKVNLEENTNHEIFQQKPPVSQDIKKDGMKDFKKMRDAYKNSSELEKLLIKENVNATNKTGQNSLMLALKEKNLEVAKEVIEKGIEITKKCHQGRNMIHYAAMSGDIEIFKYIIENGQNKLNDKDLEKNEPLFFAARVGSLEILNFLIEQNARLTIKNNDGITYLMAAAMSGNMEVFQRLIELGLKITDTDYKGRSLMWYAKKKKRKNIIKYLIEKGIK